MTTRKLGESVLTSAFNTLGGNPYDVINLAFDKQFSEIDREGYTYQIIEYDTSQDLSDPNKTYISLTLYLTPKEVELPKFDKAELIDFADKTFEADLLEQAKDTLKLVNEQLDEYLRNCKKTNVHPTMMKNRLGGYILLDLLLVKSNALSAITTLKKEITGD